MAFNAGSIVATIKATAQGVKKGVDEAKGHLDSFEKKAKQVSKTMGAIGMGLTTFVTLPLLAVGAGFIKVAADAEEMRGKFGVVFGELAAETEEWAKAQAKAMGRSRIDIMGYLADTQNMLVGMGATRAEGQELSKQIVTLAQDLASFNNVVDNDALTRMQSAIMGNHEASRSLGAVINENTLAMAMQKMGLRGTFQSLDELTKMQVRYETILMQSVDAVGDAERTATSFTNQLKAVKGEIKDMSEDFGRILLPYATRALEVLRGLVDTFNSMGEGGKKTVLTLMAVGIVIGPLLIFISELISALVVIKGAILAISGPVGWTIAAIIAIIAVLVKVWQASQQFRDKMTQTWKEMYYSGAKIWNELKVVFAEIWESIKGIALVVWGWIMAWWAHVGHKMWNSAKLYWTLIWNFIKTTIYVIKDVLALVLAIITGDWEEAWNRVKSIGETIWNAMVSSAKSIWRLLGIYIIQEIDKVLAAFERLTVFLPKLNAQVKAARAGLAGIAQGIHDRVEQEALDKAARRAKDYSDNLVAYTHDVKTGAEAASEAISGMGESLEGVGSGVKGAATEVKDVADGIKDLIERLTKDIARVKNLRGNAVAEDYFKTVWGDINQYLASQKNRLAELVKQQMPGASVFIGSQSGMKLDLSGKLDINISGEGTEHLDEETLSSMVVNKLADYLDKGNASLINQTRMVNL